MEIDKAENYGKYYNKNNGNWYSGEVRKLVKHNIMEIGKAENDGNW